MGKGKITEKVIHRYPQPGFTHFDIFKHLLKARCML